MFPIYPKSELKLVAAAAYTLHLISDYQPTDNILFLLQSHTFTQQCLNLLRLQYIQNQTNTYIIETFGNIISKQCNGFYSTILYSSSFEQLFFRQIVKVRVRVEEHIIFLSKANVNAI